MKKLIGIIIALLCWTLAGCMSQQKITYLTKVNSCKSACNQRYSLCNKSCVDTCRNCQIKSYRQAQMSELKYIHEKVVEGKMITRQLNSYRDPLQCRKITCNCAADFDACTQSCTGIIRKQLRPVTYCGPNLLKSI